MCEVVAQLVKGDISDQQPLGVGRLGLQRAKPVVDTGCGELVGALRDKHKGPRWIGRAFQVDI